MRIDNWPLDKIMRLPDWCFGRRYWIGEYMGSSTGVANTVVGNEQLPDKFVLWTVMVSCRSPSCLEALRLTLRLAADLAGFTASPLTHERLLKGVSIPSITYELYVNQNGTTVIQCGRQLIESQGRRLALIASGDQAIAYEMTAAILISALPKEVPDWLISGKDESPL